MTDFVHLHCHSEYSLLDGLASAKDLCQTCAQHGMSALALTDHGVMFGAVEFYRTAQAAGIKPIIGSELYVARGSRRDRTAGKGKDAGPYHLTVLARSAAGYQNLLQLASKAQLEGFYYKPRVDRELLEQHHEGLVITTGCPSAEVPRLLLGGQDKEAYAAAEWARSVFGRENYFVEIQNHPIDFIPELNRKLIELSRQLDIPLVATNDVHYARAKDAYAHEVLLCIQTQTTMKDPNRMRIGETFYLRSPDEMAALFPDYPEALKNTVLIAEMCDFEMKFGEYHLPVFPVPQGHTAQTYLRELCEAGLKARYGEQRAAHDPVLRHRLEHELGVIHQMGFDAYFLIVWDLCRFAKSQNIWYNARGSAAGSLVAYSLNITLVDPIQHDLIFERFLNTGRLEMPDIDLDFPDDRREQLINYTIHKYGHDKVAQIITFGTLGARAALRDSGRALDMPLAEVDRIARMIPAVPGKPVSIANVMDEEHEFFNREFKELVTSDETARHLVQTAQSLEGVSRHASTHAAGVVISDRPVVEYCPLHRPTKGDSADAPSVTQFPMEIINTIGLLKVDFLGLATLTVMQRAADLIERYHGVTYDLDTIPTDDPIAFKLLSSGNVQGVFQVEGPGMRRILQEMKPTKLEHIIALVALYRPGPLEFIPNYIRRMHGKEEVTVLHPMLEPILRETYGICVTGDALVADARTGRRYRLDEAIHIPDLVVQGVDDEWQPAIGRVTHRVHNGRKSVYKVTLRNGAQIKTTSTHQFLTEAGWRRLDEIKPGEYVATPPHLMGPQQSEPGVDRRKLRVLAYLIADGSLTSGTLCDFVSSEPDMVAEYTRCLAAFDNLRWATLTQVRNVTRVTVAKGEGQRYHEANSLLAWLRELGLKYPPDGSRIGGAGSREKFVPEFVFELGEEEIAFFLASLWDCDGYLGRKLCHYKTISQRLALDVQTLLLRLGVSSTVYRAPYMSKAGDEAAKEETGYQVTVYDTLKLADLLRRFMVSAKGDVACEARYEPTIARAPFVAELQAHTDLSGRALMAQYGIDRQHFLPVGRKRERIAAHVVAPLVAQIELPQTRRALNVLWQEVVAIEPAGVEDVYDITVEGIHSFVANNIVVHNCVYQEQVMRTAIDMAGYSPTDADKLRKAVAKKKKDDLLKQREKFVKGSVKNGIEEATANQIFDYFEAFARYGFNKGHAADYAVVTVQTAWLKANYPVEYLAALFQVACGDTEKTAGYAADAVNLGILVLPPDINKSGMNFGVEPLPKSAVRGKIKQDRGVRFGLAAVKNVGEGPVQTILDARGEKPFASLDDFARRVDLRQVNRRALECLIKAGAFDRFGNRNQLLQAIDAMMGLSAEHHRAQDVGQMSLFGGLGGGATTSLSAMNTLTLPRLDEPSRKETLAWEKDLLGTYLGEHPLTRLATTLDSKVTHSLSDLHPDMKGTPVVIAGMINSVRIRQTKKGDPFAFITIEDLAGQVDVTLFPRVYEGVKGLLQTDTLVMVRGKVDAYNDKANVLADVVSEYSLDAPVANVEEVPLEEVDLGLAVAFEDLSTVTPPVWEGDGEPEPQTVGAGDAAPMLTPAPAGPAQEPAAPPRIAETPAPVVTARTPAAPPAAPAVAAVASPAEPDLAADLTYHLEVMLPRSQNAEDDIRRLGEIHRLLTGYEGHDTFSLIVQRNGTKVQIDFPNDHTKCNKLLIKQLEQRLGANAVRVINRTPPDPREKYRKQTGT